MFEELKKKALKSSLVLSIILIIIGAVMVGLMATNMYHVVFGYADFEKLEPDEIKSQLVEYEMDNNFGCCIERYEYNTETHYRKTTSLYYVIWTGDENAEDYRFMAIKVAPSYEKRMEKMADNTANWLTSDPINVQGKIKKLNKEEYGYFVEYFEDAGWSKEEIEEGTLPYYIDCFESKTTANVGYTVVFVLGLAFLAWGIVRIVKACNGGYLKKVRKDIANAGYSESAIESDYASATELSKKSILRVGRLMTYFMSGSDGRAIPNNKMVWAYMNTITHRTNGIKTGTTYNVQIETEGAGTFTVAVDKEATALEVLKKINETLPWVVVGYSDDLKALYKKNRAEFLNLRYNTCEHVAIEPGFENMETVTGE